MNLNLDVIEQDLVWARDNADRSAQTRLFVHHVPAMLRVLNEFKDIFSNPLEVSRAQGDEEESEDTPQSQAEGNSEDGEPDENPEEETQADETVSGVQSAPDTLEEGEEGNAPEEPEETEPQSEPEEEDDVPF